MTVAVPGGEAGPGGTIGLTPRSYWMFYRSRVLPLGPPHDDVAQETRT